MTANPMNYSLKNSHIPLPVVFLFLFIVDSSYQFTLRHLALVPCMEVATVDAILYTTILWMSVRLDLAKVTLCFLALPYLFFLPGWLNLPSAAITLVIFLYCLAKTLLGTSATHETKITSIDVLAFLCIAIFVNISGAGGYGFQWDDYNMHNARIKDLVEYSWPVRYGANQNLVYYVGYFLPAAVLGKLTTLDIALRSMYVWTLLGATLAVRWLGFLSKWRFSVALVLIFILFGPMDILNVWLDACVSGTSLTDALSSLPANTDKLDFTLSYHLDFFIGNYLSNTFNLYWSPQQIIAGWLCMGLMTHLYFQQHYRSFIFIYALLCLWAPLVMLALLPFILFISATQLIKKPRDLFTLENTLGAGSLALVFISFYLAGSTNTNPSFWIFSHFKSPVYWIVLALLYFSTWGLYTLAISPFIATQNTAVKQWFGCLVFALLVLPLKTFGEWGDLLCRGSAPLMFLLLVFLLRAIHHYWHHHQKIRAALLLCLLIPGIFSSLLLNGISIKNYGQTQPVASIIDYRNAYPNLGPDNSLFERLFRRPLSNERQIEKTPTE